MQKTFNKSPRRPFWRNGPSGVNICYQPIPTSGMLSWLQPGDFSGTTWRDSSGLGNSFIAANTIQQTTQQNGNVVATLSGNYLKNISNRSISAFTAIFVGDPVNFASRLLSMNVDGNNDFESPNGMINICKVTGTEIGSYSYGILSQFLKNDGMSILVHRFGDGYIQNWQYKSGGVNTSNPTAFNKSMNISRMTIGNYFDGTNYGDTTLYGWNGPLAEVMLWNRPLTDSEITTTITTLRSKYAI